MKSFTSPIRRGGEVYVFYSWRKITTSPVQTFHSSFKDRRTGEGQWRRSKKKRSNTLKTFNKCKAHKIIKGMAEHFRKCSFLFLQGGLKKHLLDEMRMGISLCSWQPLFGIML